MRKIKVNKLFLTESALLTESQLEHLIAKLTTCGLHSCISKTHDCVVRLEDNEINFLREIGIWCRQELL